MVISDRLGVFSSGYERGSPRADSMHGMELALPILAALGDRATPRRTS
jgi:hypothetical protein